MGRRKLQMVGRVRRFVVMDAMGCSHDEILKEIFGITDKSDQKAVRNADCCMYRWRRHPEYDQVWRETIARQDYSDYVKSRTVLRRAMGDDNPWLAMQAAVNVLNTSGKRIYGAEESAVNVQISGLADLGEPDPEDG